MNKILCSLKKDRWSEPELVEYLFDANHQPSVGDYIKDKIHYEITARVWVDGKLTLEIEPLLTGLVPA